MSQILLRGSYLNHVYYIIRHSNSIEGFIISPTNLEKRILEVIQKNINDLDISYQGRAYVDELMNGELEVHRDKVPMSKGAFYFTFNSTEANGHSVFELNHVQITIKDLLLIIKLAKSTKACGLIV